MPFVKEQYEKYPGICATRVFDMVKMRGYPGTSQSHFRELITARGLRPAKQREAFLRRRTLIGDEAQVDWAHFGKLVVGEAARKLYGFLMVLSWGRMIFLRFYLGMFLENFLRGHIAAFEHFGGFVPRTILYDNLKSVVLERRGRAIRFHPTFLEFAGHYRFEPRPVGVARGNEKGRVERAVRYGRESFWAGRDVTDIDTLNVEAEQWTWNIAGERRCREDRSLTVRQALEKEQQYLLPMNENPYPTDERVATRVGKQPYVRFDKNDYSVPHKYVRRPVVICADLRTVRVHDGTEVIATHERTFSKHEQIENPEHLERLVEHKAKARKERAIDRLHYACPASTEFFTLLAQRGGNLGSTTSCLLRLLALYGAEKLNKAIAEATERGTPRYHSVRTILERWRREEELPPPVPVPLPDRPDVQDLVIKQHSLSIYDQIEKGESDEISQP